MNEHQTTLTDREAAITERASKFLDIQSYGALIPETRRMWTAWLVGFAMQELAAASAEREWVPVEDGLLPCPFCGNLPSRIDEYRTHCINDECGMYVKMMNVKDWNHRAPYAPTNRGNDDDR